MRELDIIREVAPHFELEGELMEAAPLGDGHINDTILATFATASEPRRVVFQRINTGVFRQPRELMRNMRRVTERLRTKAQDRAGSDRVQS